MPPPTRPLPAPHPPPPPPAAVLLSTWHDGVTEATAHLAALSALRTHPADVATRSAMAPALAAATASLGIVECALADLRAAVAAAEADAAAAEATEAAVAALRRRVEAVGGAVPPAARLYAPLGKGVFGGVGGRGVGGSPTAIDASAATAVPPPPPAVAPPPPVAAGPPPPAKSVAAAPAAPAAAMEPPPSAAPPGGVPRRRPGAAGGAPSSAPPPLPVIPPISEAAIAAAPQYIRGRLTAAKVASVAAALTAALAWKYGLLRRRPATLSPSDAAARDALEGVAKADTGGRPYVTEGDVRRWGGVKMDATWKGGVGLLRHVGSIKEVRGAGGKVKAWLVVGGGE